MPRTGHKFALVFQLFSISSKMFALFPQEINFHGRSTLIDSKEQRVVMKRQALPNGQFVPGVTRQSEGDAESNDAPGIRWGRHG